MTRFLSLRGGARGRIAATLLAVSAPTWASAQEPCVLRVPVTPTGSLVSVADARVGGSYPAALLSAAAAVGCSVEFAVVPRARAVNAFRTGRAADVLMPAFRTADRDAAGEFVQLGTNRLVLVWLADQCGRWTSLADVLAQPSLRLIAVRGREYGDAYQNLVNQLLMQGRADLTTDYRSAAAMLQAGRGQFMVVPELTGLDVLSASLPGRKMAAKVLRELKPAEVGIYLSRHSIGHTKRAALVTALSEAEPKHRANRLVSTSTGVPAGTN